MTRKIRIATGLLIVILLVVTILTTSLTYAKWNAGGGSGDDGNSASFGPVTDSTNWNVYAKYFTTETNDSGQLIITGFTGTNIEDVIIPEKINNSPVVAIKSIFNTTTLKELPVTIKIPSSVKSISASAFSNLPNLQTVIFASYSAQDATIVNCQCGAYLFNGCVNLEHIYVYGNREVTFNDFSFQGCILLTSAPEQKNVNIKFKDGDNDESYYIKPNQNQTNIHYTSNALTGASFTIS